VDRHTLDELVARDQVLDDGWSDSCHRPSDCLIHDTPDW